MASRWLLKTEPGEYSFDELVRLPRLSVMPVPDPVWDAILRMGGG